MVSHKGHEGDKRGEEVHKLEIMNYALCIKHYELN